MALVPAMVTGDMPAQNEGWPGVRAVGRALRAWARRVAGPALRPRVYPLLQEAIEFGAQAGVRRAYKYDDAPSQEAIAESVEREVMNGICERFTFDDRDGDEEW